MTIIPKPSAIKKGDKLEVPLVVNAGPIAGRVPDVESQNIHMQRRAQRTSNLTTCCLLLTALAVVGLGIIGGTVLYERYMREHLRNSINLNIPYTDEKFSEVYQSRLVAPDDFDGQFPEELQIDNDVEKISVPDFKDGRDGRFIHDFNTNTTGIIDMTGNRCFVMPLNRQAVLPPQSLYDLLQKMYSGYYAVDTNVVRHTMRVITPPIDDPKMTNSYIGKECEGKPIYKLEKFVSGVVKRSTDEVRTMKFTEFAGQVTQFDIVNYNELEAFEKANRR